MDDHAELLDALRAGSPAERLEILRRLAALPDPFEAGPAPALAPAGGRTVSWAALAALQGGDAELRAHVAAWLLGRVDPQTFTPLAEVLADPEILARAEELRAAI